MQFTEDITLLHGKYIKWRQDLFQDLYFVNTITDFGLLHKDVLCVTNVVKLHSFQYRFLQRGLVLNKQLCKWGLKETSLCSFCNREEETILHLFVSCAVTATLWLAVKNYIDENYPDVKAVFGPANIVQNRLVERKSHGINTLCLVTKQYIYRQRCLDKPLNMIELRYEFEKTKNIEKFIAVKNNRLLVHNRKWNVDANIGDNTNEVHSYVRSYIDENM